jgi:23S rRNA (adenine2503-C2)-methyltransferase
MKISKLSSIDGSEKYAFVDQSGARIEAAFFTVLGRERPHIACVSTQLGCAVGCRFCAAGLGSFMRNLTAEEIMLEIDTILSDRDRDAVLSAGFEVSFMGMGEPLANLPAMVSVIRQLGQSEQRITRVSVSTAGPSSRIDALTSVMPITPTVHLQISLHATDDDARRMLVPRAPDSIDNLLKAGRRFHSSTADDVCLNYVLLRGVNDRASDIAWLGTLDWSGFYLKVSQLNHVDGMPRDLQGASTDEILFFSARLRDHGVPHKVFVGDGLDVGASCGQLAAVARELPIERVAPISVE